MDQPKAVLCDDDRTTTLILKRLLEKSGFTVFTGSNGKEGLVHILAQQPCLLILDLDMPVKNGIQVLQELKQARIAPAHILVLTAHESVEDEIQVKSLGAHEMLVKPFNPAQLLQRLEQIVAGQAR